MITRCSVVVVAVSILLCESTARAEPDEMRARVELASPERAQLLERRRNELTWTVLCRGSCVVDALPDSMAEHVVTVGSTRLPIEVRARGSRQSFVVDTPSKAPLIVGAVGLGVGLTTLLSGLLLSSIGPLRPISPGDCGGDPDYKACEQRHADDDRRLVADADDRKKSAETVMVVGGLIAFAGLVTMMMQPSPKVREASAATARIRVFPTRAGQGPAVRGVTLYAPIVGGVF